MSTAAKTRTSQRSCTVQQIIASYRVSNTTLAATDLLAACTFYLSALALVNLCLAAEGGAILWLPTLIVGYVACGLAIAKLFAIQHDCGHDSYFARPYLNRVLGRACSIVTLVPFTAWREEHLDHHGCFARLDKHTFGDILLLTIEQYRSAPALHRLAYRIFRSPAYLLGLAPLGYLLLRQRVPRELRGKRLRSCASHTATIILFYGIIFYFFGSIMLLVFLPPLYVAGVVGIVIFVVEHQFEQAEWFDQPTWQFDDAALQSSSYLSMPIALEWITGYIGYHHLHHFSPRIPSYHLKGCFLSLGDSLPCKEISLLSIPRNLTLALWSRELNKLVTFREANALTE